MKYRKRPIVIDAVWWDGTAKCFNDVVLPFLADGHDSFDHLPHPPDDPNISTGVGYTIVSGMIHIPTLEGVMKASPGDWIIRGVKGEFYPCQPDIFDRTYEDAEPGAELEAERAARMKADAECAVLKKWQAEAVAELPTRTQCQCQGEADCVPCRLIREWRKKETP